MKKLTIKDFPVNTRVKCRLGLGTVIGHRKPNGMVGFINILLDTPFLFDNKEYNKYYAFTKELTHV